MTVMSDRHSMKHREAPTVMPPCLSQSPKPLLFKDLGRIYIDPLIT